MMVTAAFGAFYCLYVAVREPEEDSQLLRDFYVTLIFEFAED